MKKNICFVYKEDYPWDVRVEKIINSLIENEYEIFLICRNLDRKPIEESPYKGLRIFRLPVLPFLNDLLSIPLFFNPIWLFKIFIICKKYNTQFIIVRDLPLMLSGILIAKILRLKIVFDMAECYPEMYRSIYEYFPNKFMNFLIKNYFVINYIEKVSLVKSDMIFVMVKESEDRLLRKGISASKIRVVSNFPSITCVNLKNKASFFKENKEIHIVYIGFLTPIRGIENILYGIKKFLSIKPINKLRFHIAGNGLHEVNLRKLVFRLKLDDSVFFYGWIRANAIESLFLKADIGVVPHRDCAHWNTTIPNKLFDYMARGLPVLTTDLSPMKRVVESSDCGFVFPDGDYLDVAHKLLKLCDPDIRYRMALNGQNAILEKYNWEKEIAHVIESLELIKKGEFRV